MNIEEKWANNLATLRADHERRVRHIKLMTRIFYVMIALTLLGPLLAFVL